MANIEVLLVLLIVSLSLFSVVDPNSLVCDNDDGDDDAVCGTNGVTYPSLCRLLQDTGNEAVAYAGECDREECRGGRVSNELRTFHSVLYTYLPFRFVHANLNSISDLFKMCRFVVLMEKLMTMSVY